MPAPITTELFLELTRKSGLVSSTKLDEVLAEAPLSEDPRLASLHLVQKGLLTKFQSQQLLLGRHKGFVIGQLKILDQLGVGGMGAVYLCEHLVLNRKVAVKVLPQKQAQDPISRERFYREARAAAALDHPNIVRIHDASTHGELHYLVMEYIQGKDLHEIIKMNGPLPIKQAVGYIIQAAAGLNHAHERGLVHRDIKPSNLLVEQSTGVVKILDMGLARFFNDSKDNLTQRLDAGAVVGTIDYLAPEQAMESSNVDARADIYSLGATLYSLLTGQPPFGGTTTQKLLHHQVKDPVPLPTIRKEVTLELAAVISNMMAKNPDVRYQTPSAVIAALAPWSPDIGELALGVSLSNGSLKVTSSSRLNPATSLALANSSGSKTTVDHQPEKRGSRQKTVTAIGLIVAVIGSIVYFSYPEADQKPGPSKQEIVQQTETKKQEPNEVVVASKNDVPKKDRKVEPVATLNFKPTLVSKLEPITASKAVSMVISKNSVLSKEGEGELPEGWKVGTWNAESTTQGKIVPGEKGKPGAIGLANLEGVSAGMLFTPYFATQKNHLYLITLEYQTEGDGRGRVVYWDEVSKHRTLTDLPKSIGTWKTTNLTTVADSDSEKSRCEFHNPAVGKEHGILIRKYEVRDLGPISTKTPLWELDLASVKPGRMEIRNRVAKVIEGELIKIPNFKLEAWGPATVGEYAIENYLGQPTLVMRNFEGPSSLQLICGVNRSLFPDGKKLRVVVRYQVDDKASGEVQLRPMGVPDYLPGYQLKPTKGFFNQVEAIFTNDPNSPRQMYIQLTSSSENAAIRIASIQVFDESDFQQESTLKFIKMAEGEPFSLTVKGKDILAEKQAKKLKDQWYVQTQKSDTTVQVENRKVNGKNLLSIQTVEGSATVHLISTKPVQELKAGRNYLVRVAYQTPKGMRAALMLRDLGRQADIQSMPLSVLNGKFQEETMVLQPRTDLSLGLTIQSMGTAMEPLLIESITISERASEVSRME
jgi:eukaryotic-like serine/threonine-protein kinase